MTPPGLAVLQNGRLEVAKKAGRVEVLVKEAAKHRFTGTTGIATPAGRPMAA
jgi:glucosamine--fructose-6-phosphate aminotransferase (isomerizing)